MPQVRPNRVPRPRLSARLDEGLQLGRRLTLVSAPPGFGKTTLIGEWAGGLDVGVAWLTLDEADNDAVSFIRYVLAALQQVDERIGQTIDRQHDGIVAANLRVLATVLINDLATWADGLLLVLDDYHVITSLEVHDLLAFLIENQPGGFHIVIGTREDPVLPLARMRARGQLTEMREAALRFTRDEAAAFLNGTMRLALVPEAVAALGARTEGWITGLQLAGLALQNKDAAEDFVSDFAGDDRYVIDYLMTEVLERQTEPVRDFLRQTSILERLTAPLCDVLTRRNDGQETLETIEAANLFLIPLDHRREWYRYHRLFAEVLRLTLSSQEETALHRRASQWFEANGDVDPAIRHAMSYGRCSGDTTDAERMMGLARVQGIPSRPDVRARLAGRPQAAQTLIEPLTERELEVLGLIAAGYSNAEIAQELFIALGTVKRHINNMYGKLEVGSRTQAIARARELGLLV